MRSVTETQDATRPSSSTKLDILGKEQGLYREISEWGMSNLSGVATDTSLIKKEVRRGLEWYIPFVTGTSKTEGFYQIAKGVLKLALCVIGLLLLLYTSECTREYVFNTGMNLFLRRRYSVSSIAKLSTAPSTSFVKYCCWSFAGCLLGFL